MRRVLAALKSALPNDIPNREQKVITLLRAARHVQRYPATDTRRGRRSKFDRTLLIKVGARLIDILDRETSSRVSIASFVDHYLRLLQFPADVLDALRAGDVNLFEASQLSRVTPDRLAVSASQAANTRRSLLKAHLAAHASTTALRLRINELLGATTGEVSNGDGHGAASVLEEIDLDLLDEFDPTHLFYDQLKQLVIALREIQPADIKDEEIEELLKSSAPVFAVLAKIQRRKERRVVKADI